MTKKEIERIEDLERRVLLLEKELINSLLGASKNQSNMPKGYPQWTPPTNQTIWITCPKCGLAYDPMNIHQCISSSANSNPLTFGSSPNATLNNSQPGLAGVIFQPNSTPPGGSIFCSGCGTWAPPGGHCLCGATKA